MLDWETFIFEFLAVDGFTASAIPSCEVATLDHEPSYSKERHTRIDLCHHIHHKTVSSNSLTL